MTTLSVIRHGLSTGNVARIIQGRKDEYPLCPAGISEVTELGTQHPELKRIDRIIAGPLRRTRETANILATQFGKTVIYDDALTEVDPGILTGVPHREAEVNHPNEYATWMRRGDLDAIAGAEKGEEVQARILSFLEQYRRLDGKDLIISHAATNRCLVNTVLGRPRKTPIDVAHSAIHVLQDPWSRIDARKIPTGKTADVYSIDTPDGKYLLKVHEADGAEGLRKKIMTELAREGSLAPRPMYIRHSDNLSIQVMEYLPGSHRFGPLDEIDEARVIDAAMRVKKQLSKHEPESEPIPSLYRKLATYAEGAQTPQLKEWGQELLENPQLRASLISDKALIHYDLHRSNILFEGEKLHIIDFDGLIAAPSDFQAASTLMACFLLEEPTRDMNKLVTIWPEPLSTSIYSLMSARAFIGAAFFEKRLSKGTSDDRDLFTRYVLSGNALRRQIRLQGAL